MRFLDTRSMPGHLSQYAPGRQAFASQPPPFARCAILVGGLSDGMLACPYAPALTDALAKEGWATVQPLLRTSHLQFGFGSLDGDAEDLDALLEDRDGPLLHERLVAAAFLQEVRDPPPHRGVVEGAWAEVLFRRASRRVARLDAR